ncbi:unnamed protein product [Prunus armeniaca]
MYIFSSSFLFRDEGQLGGTRLVVYVTGSRGRQEECSARHLPSKRKADLKSSRNEAATSWAKDVSQLRKKPRIPSAEKTKVGVVPCHQLGLNISLMHIARRLVVGAIFWMFHSSLLQTSLETMIYTMNWFTCRKAKRFKRGVDLASLTSLEVRMKATKKTRESSSRAKCSSSTSAVDLRWTSPSLQGMQAGDLGTFSSLSLEKLREATFHLLKKGVAFAAETSRNPFVVAPSSAANLLLARFRAYHKSAKKSKFEATMDAYKLGCLDCKNGYAPLYAIGDEEIEELCPDFLNVQSE